MALKRSRTKWRQDTGPFVALPHRVLKHENFVRLSPSAVKLLVDLASQYTGNNNGDLCATYSLMQTRGWKSKETLQNARNELIHYGIIMLTRQGGRNMPSLYALTWFSVDECKGKLDFPETRKPPGDWRQPREKWVRPSRSKKPAPIYPGIYPDQQGNGEVHPAIRTKLSR